MSVCLDRFMSIKYIHSFIRPIRDNPPLLSTAMVGVRAFSFLMVPVSGPSDQGPDGARYQHVQLGMASVSVHGLSQCTWPRSVYMASVSVQGLTQ